MPSAVAEKLSHGAARVRGQILQRRGVGCGGTDNHRVLQRIGVVQALHQLRHGRSLLPDGHVDAVELLLLVRRLVEPLLIDDGIDSDGGLSAAETKIQKQCNQSINQSIDLSNASIIPTQFDDLQ